MNAAALLLCALPPPAPGPRPCDLPDVDTSDVFRFPPAAVLQARMSFADRHLEWLDARAAALGPSWRDAECDYREELGRRLDLWKLAQAAALTGGECRTAYLRDLRRDLGVAAYNRGELPELPDPAWMTRGD